MIIPIAAVIALISMVAENFIGYNGDQAVLNVILQLIGKGIGEIFEVGLHVFFWLTLVFVILERRDTDKGVDPLTTSLCESSCRRISWYRKRIEVCRANV